MGVSALTPYRQHLQSEHWQEIRREAADRWGGLCEFCKGLARETHHIKYPKGYANDSVENVAHVCSACHRRLHGMNPQKQDKRMELVEVKTFRERRWSVEIDESGWVWQSWSGWADALVIPARTRIRILPLVLTRVIELERQTPDELHRMFDEKGEPFLTWMAVAEGLHVWERTVYGRHDSKGRPIPLDDEERSVLDALAAVRMWGHRLQNDAMRGRLQQRPAGNVVPMTDADHLAMIVQHSVPLLKSHQTRIADHEQRLVLIEAASVKDPDEAITATDFLIEVGKNPRNRVTIGGECMDAWLGQHCKRVLQVASQGVRWVRENPYSSKQEKRNLWRRADLQRAFEAMPKG